MLIQFLINGFINGTIYSLVALGFAIVYNTTRIFHIAYAILYMMTPYFVATFYTSIGLPFFIAATLAIILTMVISMGIHHFFYTPIEKKEGSLHVLMICSLGIMIIGINIIALIYGNETKILNNELSRSIVFGNIIVTFSQLWQLFGSGLIILFFILFIEKSSFGVKTRALCDDKDLCEIYTLNIPLFKLGLYALSGFLVALGGILMAWDIGMDPYVGMPMLLNAVVAVIIGGIGKFYAPIIGGLILGILQSVVVWQFSTNWQETITFAVLIIFLLFRPQGLLGEKKREA